MATRTYVIGLPVVVMVDDEGNVEYEVDTSEAAVAISEEENANSEFLDQDVISVRLDHMERMR